MYTKEKLESVDFIRLYKSIGNRGLKKLNEFENFLIKNNVSKDLNIKLKKESLRTKDNTIYYTNNVHLNNKGTYLITNITKEKGINLLDISLELGKEGFDYSTGERYEKKQAKVDYTYDNNKVDIKRIEDELFYNELEEKRKKETYKRVLSLKK